MSRSRQCPSQSNGIIVRDSSQSEFCNTIPPKAAATATDWRVGLANKLNLCCASHPMISEPGDLCGGPGTGRKGRQAMQSPVIKRSIVIAGHKTSVSLEDAFWRGAQGDRNRPQQDIVGPRRRDRYRTPARQSVVGHPAVRARPLPGKNQRSCCREEQPNAADGDARSSHISSAAAIKDQPAVPLLMGRLARSAAARAAAYLLLLIRFLGCRVLGARRTRRMPV